MAYIHKSVSNYLFGEEIKKNLKIPSVRFPTFIPTILKLQNTFPKSKEVQIKQGSLQQKSVLEDYK